MEELLALEAASHRLASYGLAGIGGAVAVGVERRGAGRVRDQGSHRSARVGTFLMSVVELGSRRQSRLSHHVGEASREVQGSVVVGVGSCCRVTWAVVSPSLGPHHLRDTAEKVDFSVGMSMSTRTGDSFQYN